MITGAARGIGAASANAFAALGWTVVAVDVCHDLDGLGYPMATRAELDAVVDACGNDAVAVVADVRDGAALSAAANRVVERFGRLDAAVAAAGVIVGSDWSWQLDDVAFGLALDVNLGGVHRLAAATLDHLVATAAPGTGRFVAVASAAGVSGRPSIAAYTAAKHGVIGYVRSIAAELAPLGVTANCVAPGSTDTAILAASADVYGLADRTEFTVHHPIGRLLDPSEIAAGIVWLCAPERGGVTGIVLPIDGGMTL